MCAVFSTYFSELLIHLWAICLYSFAASVIFKQIIETLRNKGMITIPIHLLATDNLLNFHKTLEEILTHISKKCPVIISNYIFVSPFVSFNNLLCVYLYYKQRKYLNSSVNS